MTPPVEFSTVPPLTSTMQEEGYTFSRTDKCSLFLCQGGELDIIQEDKTYHIRQGDIYISPLLMSIQIKHRSKDLKGVVLTVDIDYVLTNAKKTFHPTWNFFIYENPCLSLTKEQYVHIDQLIDALRKRIAAINTSVTNTQQKIINHELVTAMGEVLYYEILSIYFARQPQQPQHKDRKDHVFQNFIISLYQNHRMEREVTYYAQEQYLTPRYFSAIIKEKSGISALQWIIRMVIADAKQMLRSSDLSIKEIASELNFSTQSFFGKYFKQYVGISPTEYRNGKLVGQSQQSVLER